MIVMKRESTLPKYAAAVIAQAEANPLTPGTVNIIDIFHDDWCDLLRGKGRCNCNPIVGEPVEATKYWKDGLRRIRR